MSKLKKIKHVKSNFTIYFIVILIIFFTLIFLYLYNRYHVNKTMVVNVKEFNHNEYPDNPASISHNYGHYSHPRLLLEKNDDSHFNFVFLPGNQASGTLIFKNIDVGLMTPSVPTWIRQDPDLTRISLTDRQWNRQQVSFSNPSQWIEIKGGDSFEKNKLVQAELAKNCLNAGLWEILLYSQENGKRTLFYQGWFTFPLGHYKTIFEQNSGLSYRNSWYYLEHWVNPAGTSINFDKLRTVIQSYPVKLQYDFNESAIANDEQINKKKNIITKKEIKRFQDYYNNDVQFSTFLPPGIYRKDKPWKNEYWRIKKPMSAVINDIRSPASPDKPLHEIVIQYLNDKNNPSFIYISGFDLNQLPHLDINDYSQGKLYLMGIGTAPLKENYPELIKNQPDKSPLFSVYVDEKNKWINHHDVAIDGAILFLDKQNTKLLHIYLVSYERHAVVAHYWIELPNEKSPNRINATQS